MKHPLLGFVATVVGLVFFGCGRSHHGVDHGAPSDQYPAPHSALPLMVKGTGDVLSMPVFTAVTFPGDPLQVQKQDFVATVGSSQWWSAVSADYGVSPASATAAVVSSSAAPITITFDEIPGWIATELASSTSGWPAPVAGSIYVILFPSTTTVQAGPGASCTNFGGFHYSVSYGGGDVAYAIIADCPGLGLPEIDAVTAFASHEMIEAATDPHASETAASGWGFSSADAAWAVRGPEVADLCTVWTNAYVHAGAFPYLVQRSYSNSAAAASHDPCVPGDSPYFAAAAVVKDTFDLDVGAAHFANVKGVKLPVGSTKTIELDLFSDASTGGPFQVSLNTLDLALQPSSAVTATLDRSSGQNGEKLYATITAVSAASPAVIVVADASIGAQHYYWPIVVSN